MTSWDGRQHSFEKTLSLVIKAVCYHPQRMSWDWPVLKLFSWSYLVTYLWKWYKEKTKLNVNGITWKIPNFFCGAALSAVIWTEWKCVCKGSRTIRSLQKGSCVGNSSWSVCLIHPFTTFHLIWQRTPRGGSKRAVFVSDLGWIHESSTVLVSLEWNGTGKGIRTELSQLWHDGWLDIASIHKFSNTEKKSIIFITNKLMKAP